MSPERPPKVFISYSHDSDEHKQRVLELADRLRRDGIDTTTDQHETSPSEGWPRWVKKQITESDFILVVCTPIYQERVELLGKGDGGRGEDWESVLTLQDLYNRSANDERIIPVVFSKENVSYIPVPLQSAIYYLLTAEKGYQLLLRRLHTPLEEKAPKSPASGEVTTVSTQPTTKIAPPVISKAFGAASIALNATTKLTFTIKNQNPNAGLTGIEFIDVFPAGLRVANPKDLVGYWGEGALRTSEGSDRIVLSGAVLPPGGSCSFQLNVTGISAGTKNNTTSQVSSVEGGTGGTASASLLVSPANPGPNSPGNEAKASDWFDRATINRFSEQTRALLNRANEIRIAARRPAVSVFDLVNALAEEDPDQSSGLTGLINIKEFGGLEFYSSLEGPPQESAFEASWKFPPITQPVRLTLIKARDKADELSSPLIDESHVLFGLLSLSEINHPLIQELNKRGITPDKINFPTSSQTGPSTHVARDRWTTQDSLGYFPYAYAIYKFLTDKNTAPPLAISIQAPWGGGKTSMMRMIQGQLDPESLKKIGKAPAISEKATIKDVQEELIKLSGDKAGTMALGESARFQVPSIASEGERRVTIWFNAWKYESTAQVWAGLADSIVHQIGDRLNPVEREMFWLRLRLRHIDATKIRDKIHAQLLNLFWEKWLGVLWVCIPGLILSLSVALTGKILQNKGWESVGWVGTVLTSILTSVTGAAQWKKSESKIQKQPAAFSLGECVEAPEYAKNLGFIHQVVEDLRRVFEIIPKKHLPMVIFIDDLDRCSPNKVSDVIEAVNLFLAGEFPDCMFVMGIDDEMVAAALNKAHSEVISKLPSYAKSASIGWRFMDKFVQLPFIVPPPTRAELKKYADSLLSEDSGEPAEIDIETRNKVTQVIENAGVNVNTPQQVVQEVAKEKSLSSQQQQVLKEEVVVIQHMDRNIRAFSDEEKKIRDLLTVSAADFSANPRDIKRFVNVFRFYYFLRAARDARKDPVPSLTQLSRWILFSLKWPEAVRYLSRIQLGTSVLSHPQFAGLEKAGKESQNLDDWKKNAGAALGMNADDNPWLSSQEMMRFFKAESGFGEAERLSASCGKGLW